MNQNHVYSCSELSNFFLSCQLNQPSINDLNRTIVEKSQRRPRISHFIIPLEKNAISPQHQTRPFICNLYFNKIITIDKRLRPPD